MTPFTGLERFTMRNWWRLLVATIKECQCRREFAQLPPKTRQILTMMRANPDALKLAGQFGHPGTAPPVTRPCDCHGLCCPDTLRDGIRCKLGEQIDRYAPQAAPPAALDVSLLKERALHRVWRALNDGDCPKCHKHVAATEVVRLVLGGVMCPNCHFHVTGPEIDEIERLFAPAMDAAVEIFEEWRLERTRTVNHE